MRHDRQLKWHQCIDWHQKCLLCRKLYRRRDGASTAVRLCNGCWELVQHNQLKEMVHATDGERVHCALYHYTNEARDLLWHYKFNAIKSIAHVYTRVVSDAWMQWFEGCTLVPIPASINTIKRRGWDQISIIAKMLAAAHGIEVLSLIKRTGRQATKKMDRARRLSAVRSQYGLSKNFQKQKSGAHRVVLFDDVYTTGTTIATCSEILQLSGVEVQGSLTLYRS